MFDIMTNISTTISDLAPMRPSSISDKHSSQVTFPNTGLPEILKYHLQRLKPISLSNYKDFETMLLVKKDVESILEKLQKSRSDLMTAKFIPFLNCTLVSQDTTHFSCKLEQDRDRKRSTIIKLRSKYFSDSESGDKGFLIHDWYESRFSGRECFTKMDDLVVFLNPECCNSLKSPNPSPKSCPFFPIKNAPSLYKLGPSFLPMTSEQFTNVICPTEQYQYQNLKDLATSCSLKSENSARYGTGSFLGQTPKTAIVSPMETETIALIVVSSVLASTCLSCCIIITLLIYIRFKPNKTSSTSLSKSSRQIPISKDKEMMLMPQTNVNIHTQSVGSTGKAYSDRVLERFQ